MRNLKRTMAMLLSLVMVAATFAGCGKNDDSSSQAQGTTVTADPSKNNPANVTQLPSGGKELVVYSWNDEFEGMLKNYYLKDHPLPSGVTLKYVNTGGSGEYQQKLDLALKNEKIDLFLMEAGYAQTYVDSDLTMPIAAVGINQTELANQYQYTIQIATDSEGVIKGTSWQAAPGCFVYRSDLAEKYLGVKTPDEMQAQISDWDKFLAAAQKVNTESKGATKICTTIEGIWTVFSAARSSAWVTDGKLVISDEAKAFMEFAKKMESEKLYLGTGQWNEAWNAAGATDKTMGYFISTWGFPVILEKSVGGTKVGEGTFGKWAACLGPQSWYWGGTWMTAAATCDNADIVADIMKYFTINKDSMAKYAKGSNDFVNNKEAIKDIVNSDYKNAIIGGQNQYALLTDVADKLDLKAMSGFDTDINTAFNTEYLAYARGEKDMDTAINDFKKAVAVKLPNLTVE